MSSTDHNVTNHAAASKEENHCRAKSGPAARPPQDQVLIKCPRCDSPNTKFCYYNNYSLTQPRHFCKTCRRYWTKGGALRNVPIGGGCRKNKKMIKYNSSSSRFSFDSSKDNSSSSSEMIVGGLKFFTGLSPAMDFNLGGLSSSSPSSSLFPRLNNNNIAGRNYNNNYNNQLSTSFGDQGYDPSGNNSTLLGFNNNYPLIASMGSLNVNSSLANSIESLSSINQDLHWKLQQERLATLFGDTQKENNHAQNKPQPILFQNLEISKPISGGGGDGGGSGNDHQPVTTTEWFFGNCYNNAPVAANNINPAESSGGGNENAANNNWNGAVQTWSGTDLHQYTAFP